MGWKLGAPSLKLNNAGTISKHCGDFSSVAKEALEEREGHDPDIDRERAALNQFVGFRTAAELQEYSRKHIEQLSAAQQAAGGRKVRADAVVMCVTILKPPAAMMNAMSLDDQRRFLDDAHAAFADIVGQDNIKARADHFDELGAHSHIFWEPMTADGRLCAKERHSLKFFGRVNQELPQRLREQGWEIEDCEMYDAAKEEYQKAKQSGRSSMSFKAEAEQAKQQLEAEIVSLEKTAQDARQRAQDALQEAQDAESKAEALRDAVSPPAVLQGLQVKKTIFGGVKMSKSDFEVVRQAAEGSAVALADAAEMESERNQAEVDLQAALQESKKLRQESWERQLKIYDLTHTIEVLQRDLIIERKRYQLLKEQAEQASYFTRGIVAVLVKMANLLPGHLGDKIYVSFMEKVFNREMGSRAACDAFIKKTRQDMYEIEQKIEAVDHAKIELRNVERSNSWDMSM